MRRSYLKRVSLFDAISGIYKITCIISSTYYIGSSKNVKRRIGEHFYRLRQGIHDSKRFQYTWNKYGESAFVCEVLEECNEDQLLIKEKLYIDKLSPKLNGTLEVGRPPISNSKKMVVKNYKTNDIVECSSLTEFSHKYGISMCQISALLNKRIKSTGDWCLPDYTPKQYKLKDSDEREYIFYSPTQFAEEHGLSVDKMKRLFKGVIPFYNGWHLPNIKYITKEPYIFFQLDGKTETVKDGELHKFAISNNLIYMRILGVIAHRQKSTGGWYLRNGYLPKYSILDSNGIIRYFEKISEFAKEHNISKSCLSILLRGKMKSHQGWTCLCRNN
jgi:hypothetical protein